MGQKKLFDGIPNEKQVDSALALMAMEGSWDTVKQSMGKHEFEEFLEDESMRIAMQLPEYIINVEPAYGATREDMKCFRSKDKSNYNALENIVYGLNNCEPPHRMLREMNTSEILGLYLGAGNLKRYGKVASGKQDVKYKEFMQSDFVRQVSLLVSHGYRYQGIRTMRNRGFKEHPNKRDDMKRRMEGLDYKTKEDFIASLKKPTVVSDTRDRYNGFGDPNQERLRDWTAKNIYINYIVGRLESLSRKNAR